MMNDTIKTSIRHLDQDAIIDLEGDVTTFSDEEIDRAYQSVLDIGGKRILLNFDKVNYINSAGIGILINLILAAKEKNFELGIYGISPHFKKIFSMVGITKYAEVFQDEMEALGN